jgi:hypothetical protein
MPPRAVRIVLGMMPIADVDLEQLPEDRERPPTAARACVVLNHSRPMGLHREVAPSRLMGLHCEVAPSRPMGLRREVGLSRPMNLHREVAPSRPMGLRREVGLSRPMNLHCEVGLSRPMNLHCEVALSPPMGFHREVTLSRPMTAAVAVRWAGRVDACNQTSPGNMEYRHQNRRDLPHRDRDSDSDRYSDT